MIESAYSRFKQGPITCERCGWSGKGADCTVGEVFEGGQISEYHCPKCDQRLAAVPWPMAGEAQF